MAGKKTYQPGEVIIEEKTYGTTAYIIERGRVEVSSTSGGTKVVLGHIGKDEIFGEIGLLEDTPRTATIIALEEVAVTELDREDFNDALLKNPQLIMPILKGLFERLRQVNRLMVEVSGIVADLPNVSEPKVEESAPDNASVVVLRGLTEISEQALGGRDLVISKFPFKVGRETSNSSHDALSSNDLYLTDHQPFNVSRNHFSINQSFGHYYLVDRGSKLGTHINEQRLGGGGECDRLRLEKGEHTLIVGSRGSAHRFCIVVD